MSVGVVVPWRGGCPHRERAWRWALPRYSPIVVVGEPPFGPWCKAAAVMPAIEHFSVDIVVVADADVWVPRLAEAIEAVRQGRSWAVPHRMVRRLTENATTSVLAGGELGSQALERQPYEGVIGGGVLVARREVLLDCPMDPRFVGWGQEDGAHGLALTRLYGQPWRPDGPSPLYHLFHPAQERLSRVRGSRESWALYRRYRAARRDTQAMRQIVEEAHVALADHLDALHAGACVAS